MRGFQTSEEAHEWIRTYHFDMDFEMQMVFYDGKESEQENYVEVDGKLMDYEDFEDWLYSIKI